MANMYDFEKGKEKGYPERCPITGLPYFMEMELDGEMVPTYGGPFDSYTIPTKDEHDEDGGYIRERYDHDEGAWVGCESISNDYILNTQPPVRTDLPGDPPTGKKQGPDVF